VDDSSWYFSEYSNSKHAVSSDQMNILRSIVSETVGVSDRGTFMVGSAKVGCSLSPGQKRFRSFRQDSDIDIVVISLRLFARFWNRLQDVQRYRNKRLYVKQIMPSIFRGYINEKPLMCLDKIGNEWLQTFSEAKKRLQNELGIIHRVSFRVYRCQEDFERYHLRGIAYLKTKKGI